MLLKNLLTNPLKIKMISHNHNQMYNFEFESSYEPILIVSKKITWKCGMDINLLFLLQYFSYLCPHA